MPYEANWGRRNMRDRFRACDGPQLLAWPTANGATAMPQILNEATYTGLASMKPQDAPAHLANGIYGYIAGPDEKILALEFCSVAGADGNTQVWELGLYSRPQFTNTARTTYTGWLCFGTAYFTLTLGLRSLASQNTDPYVNSQSFTNKTLRWADAYAETSNDFSNSSAGFYQVWPMGYNALDKSGHVMVDMSFASLLCIRLVTKAASSDQELVGLYREIN